MADRANIHEAERARVLAARYPQLLGLRFLPWGVVVGLTPLVTGSLVTGSTWWVVLCLFLASIPAAAVLTWVSVRYYRRWFGQVRAKPPSGLEFLGWVAAFGTLAVLYWLLQNLVGTDRVGDAGLVYAAILAFAAWRMGPFAVHRLALAGLLALAGVLPLGMLTESGTHPLAMSEPSPLMILGACMVVIGLVDHWLLVHTFHREGNGQP